ncbi:hypothetical protein EHV23_06110 [Lautropia dentalis]|uniref:2'-5' RNA ligase family protein n=1 Tax=Lautropia dentalis TaxID=2490857 RepID=A0A3R8LQ25_9BURK|nr:hypothetical protein [Lautropia dentalis]RRN45719.1 hypothetical protein EHV23_06110 [Lautropia dentalis]
MTFVHEGAVRSRVARALQGESRPMLPCAWWLLPAQPQHARLQRLIGQLAGEFGGPVFEPHMTLALGELPAAWLYAQTGGVAGESGRACATGAAGTAGPVRPDDPRGRAIEAGTLGAGGAAAGTAGPAGTPAPAARWAQRLAGLLPAITLNTDGIGHVPHHFRIFHLRLAPSAGERAMLTAWRAWLRAALRAAQVSRLVVDVCDPGFRPHLSLAYGDWPEAQRAAQAMRVAPMLPACLAAGAGSHGAGEGSRGNGLLQFDTLLGICPRPGAQDMARVADWHVFARVPLRP